jgi:hypothetical protein
MKEHEVLMRLDPKLAMILTKIRPDYKPFLDADGTLVVQLDKALYGCVESARLWYDHLRKTLEAMGFQANPDDICTFNKGSVQAGDQCTIILHVDDLMVTSKQQAVVDKVVADIVAVYKEVTVNRGAVHSYLGMTFDFTVPGQVKVSQEGYVQDLIKASGGEPVLSQRGRREAVQERDRGVPQQDCKATVPVQAHETRYPYRCSFPNDARAQSGCGRRAQARPSAQVRQHDARAGTDPATRSAHQCDELHRR